MSAVSSNTGRTARVLLVDDNDAHRYSLSRHLAGSGFDVLQAKSGNETLELAMSQHPDVILLDIHLPDMLGFQVCRSLKEDTTTRSIPVVFHSATYDTQAARSQAVDLGALAFLSYPIDVDHLINVVRGAIARTHTQHPSDEA